MKVAILSDIHANQLALQAVLQDAQMCGVEQQNCWILGDLIDYGPCPLQVLRWFKETVYPGGNWVSGNHEAIAYGDWLNEADLSTVAGDTRISNAFTRVLIEDDAELAEFARMAFTAEHHHARSIRVSDGEYILLHHTRASLQDFRTYADYLYPWRESAFAAGFQILFEGQSKRDNAPAVAFFGHTHVPALLKAEQNGEQWDYESIKMVPFQTYSLEGGLFLVNPGSVGQPRDLDRRPAYGLLDTDARSFQFRRIDEAFVSGENGYCVKDVKQQLRDLHKQNHERLKRDKKIVVAARRLSSNFQNMLEMAPLHADAPQEWVAHFQFTKGIKENE